MFCVFLQNTPPKEDLLVTVSHNKDIYTFSRNLATRHSSILADLIVKNEDHVIFLDYYHKHDDFQLICNLFNYKRIFINHLNIGFLEFAAKYLQIPVLINKVTKYRNHYNEFIKNPTFQKIDSMRGQIFSNFKLQVFSDESSDGDYEEEEEEANLNENENNDQIILKTANNDDDNETKYNDKNEIISINSEKSSTIENENENQKEKSDKKKSEKLKENQNDINSENEKSNEESNTIETENQNEIKPKIENEKSKEESNTIKIKNQDFIKSTNEKTNEESYIIKSEEEKENQNEPKESDISIKYDNEYLSTVSHIVFSAILSDPFNASKYVSTIIKDDSLFHTFIETLTSSPLNSSFIAYLKTFFLMQLEEKKNEKELFEEQIKLYENSKNFYNDFILDTNLEVYLNDICFFFREQTEFITKYQFLNDLIKEDQIDEFQIKYVLHPKISNNKDNFVNFFKTSMIYSSIKCFKYFVLNIGTHFSNFKVDYKMMHSAIIGGNIEIIRFLFDKYSGSPVDFIKDLILFNKCDILRWMIQNKCQFLSIYNSCCSKVLYGEKCIKQKWYRCKKCHIHHNYGCCKFCAKHCHLNKNAEKLHKPKFKRLSTSCFCDDDCELSKNIEIEGNKEFVEIDDLILLSFYCLNTDALKILVNEGGNILRCRDGVTQNTYLLNDSKMKEIIKKMKGFKENAVKFDNKSLIYFLNLSSDYESDNDDEDDEENNILRIPHLLPIDL